MEEALALAERALVLERAQPEEVQRERALAVLGELAEEILLVSVEFLQVGAVAEVLVERAWAA